MPSREGCGYDALTVLLRLVTRFLPAPPTLVADSDQLGKEEHHWPHSQTLITEARRLPARGRAAGHGARCAAPATDGGHIQPGDHHDTSNLQTLCHWHHARKSAAEGAAARGRRVPRRRPESRHPDDLS
ncbi:hypothetical protein GCM10009544_02240 [Streptomyces stramineus]|uniref:HNH endonuclease n=1 Tax=Streptomyces stramineus TaxID=173861 RepID=A0ABN0ZC45_9ACTN